MLKYPMSFRLRVTLVFFALLLLLAVTVPLIFPVPELETVPARQLAGPDARFAEVNEIDLHYTETGTAPPTLLLLHGFGSSTFSWRKVTGPLGRDARVVAFDRPGFGFSERLLVTSAFNPYTPQAQVDLTLGLMDALTTGRAVLVGQAAGGALAVQLALAHPERVAGLVLVGPVLQSGGPPAWARGLFGTPQAERLGPYVVRQFAEEPGLELLRRSYADPDRLTEADVAGYQRPFRADGWDRALWEVTKANPPTDLSARLAGLAVPTLVVAGAEDSVIPLEQHERVAATIPEAELEVLPDCGHAPHEECPQKFSAAVTTWLNSLQENRTAN